MAVEGVGLTYHVAINGQGFVLAENPGTERQYTRRRVPMETPRFAEGSDSYAQGVDRYQFTQWLSWLGGGFQTHADRPNSDPVRFFDSHDSDPFQEQFELHNRPKPVELTHPSTTPAWNNFTDWDETKQILTAAHPQERIIAIGYDSDEDYIGITRYVTGTDSWEAVWEIGGGVDFAAATSNGNHYWVANNLLASSTAQIRRFTTDSGTSFETLSDGVFGPVSQLDFIADRLALASYVDEGGGAFHLKWTTISLAGDEDTTSTIEFPQDNELAATNTVFGNGVAYFGVGNPESLTIYQWRPGSGETPSIAAVIPEGGVIGGDGDGSKPLAWYNGALYVASLRENTIEPDPTAGDMDHLIWQCIALDDGTVVPSLLYESYDRYHQVGLSGDQSDVHHWLSADRKLLFTDRCSRRHPSVVSAFDPSTAGVARWFGSPDMIDETAIVGMVRFEGQFYTLSHEGFWSEVVATQSGGRLFTLSEDSGIAAVSWDAGVLAPPDGGTPTVIATLDAAVAGESDTVDISGLTTMAGDKLFIVVQVGPETRQVEAAGIPSTWELVAFDARPLGFDEFMISSVYATEDLSTSPLISIGVPGTEHPTIGPFVVWSVLQVRNAADPDTWFALAGPGPSGTFDQIPTPSITVTADDSMYFGVATLLTGVNNMTFTVGSPGVEQTDHGVTTADGISVYQTTSADVIEVAPAEMPEGVLDLSIVDKGSLRTKVFDEVRISTRPLPPGSSVEVLYSFDRGASFTSLDTLDTTDATNATFRFPSNTIHEDIMLRLVRLGEAVVDGVELKLHQLGMYDDIIECVVDCRDNIRLANGAPHPGNGPGAGRARYRALSDLVQSIVDFEDLDFLDTQNVETVEVLSVEPLEGVHIASQQRGEIETGEIARVTLRRVGA